MRYFLLICNLFFCTNLLFSQQYSVANISTIDGLGNNCIQSIYKDSRGILWVGTAIGLSKIENQKIQNLSTDNGIAPNGCWAITEDQNHNMWFGSYGGGITFYDGKKFLIVNEKNGLCNNKIRKLFCIKNQLFVGTSNGFSVIDVTTKKIQSYTSFGTDKDIMVTGFFEYKEECYIGTYSDNIGVWKYNKWKKLVKINSESNIVSLNKIKDSILMYGNYTLKYYSIDNFIKNSDNFKTYTSSPIWDCVITKTNDCFIAQQDFNTPTGGVFKLLKNKIENYNNYFNINSKQIWCLFYDKTFNQLYVGSQDKGLFIVDLNKEITYTNFNNEDIKSILKIDSTKVFLSSSSIYFEKNKIIKKINSATLINYIDKFYQQKRNIIYAPNYKDFLYRKKFPIAINSYDVYNTNLFISTTLGFFKFSKEGTILDFHPIIVKYFKMLGEYELIAFRDYCPAIYYKDIRLIENWKELDLKDSNNPRDIANFTSINNSLYLVSYLKGLYKYENKKSHSYLANQQWTESTLLTSCKNDKGQLLVASQRGDIYVIAPTEKFPIIKKIKNNEIHGSTIIFLESYKDYIIVGTNLGLNFYKNGVTIFLDEKNGLKSKLFNSAYRDHDTLFLATTIGYYELDLKKVLAPKKQACTLAITKLDVNYKALYNSELKWYTINKQHIDLPYNSNTLSIEFAPKNSSDKAKLVYSFKVEGLKNSIWSKWTTDASILLPFLPDGNFTILVQTKDLSLGTICTQKLLSITITPPFWETMPFIIVAITLIGFLIFFYIKNRINKINLENEIQKRMIETKMEAVQSQMNPHFTFNAMNSIQNYIVRNKMEDALEYLADFSRLIRKTLDNSIKATITLEEEIYYLQDYVNLENKRYTTPVDFTITISDTINPAKVEIPPMLIQPFIENCFVHAFTSKTENPYLKLDITLNSNLLTITIRDNGIGFNTELKKINSIGINLVKERINLSNAENSNFIEIVSTINKGTKVTFQINSKSL